MPDVGAQDHGVLWDTVLDDFEGLPDVPVGAGDRPDVLLPTFLLPLAPLCPVSLAVPPVIEAL